MPESTPNPLARLEPAAQAPGIATAAARGVHVDLDGGATSAAAALGLARVDARDWGPRLRYLTGARTIDAFASVITPQIGDEPFVLMGSGDFHHVSAAWQRRIREPYHLLCFDNHPDWDIRPPRWACGAWVCRALERSEVRSGTVWGCGNFELGWPSRLFGCRDARLTVRPWRERVSEATSRRFACVTRATWRSEYADWLESLDNDARIYVSIDLDCLRSGAAITNWEHGLFETEDLEWALGLARSRASLIGGDLCGGWSRPEFATIFQRLAAWWDHPKPALGNSAATAAEAARLNAVCTERVWRAMVSE